MDFAVKRLSGRDKKTIEVFAIQREISIDLYIFWNLFHLVPGWVELKLFI